MKSRGIAPIFYNIINLYKKKENVRRANKQRKIMGSLVANKPVGLVSDHK